VGFETIRARPTPAIDELQRVSEDGPPPGAQPPDEGVLKTRRVLVFVSDDNRIAGSERVGERGEPCQQLPVERAEIPVPDPAAPVLPAHRLKQAVHLILGQSDRGSDERVSLFSNALEEVAVPEKYVDSRAIGTP
jgi:hypothetical protein